MAHSHQQLAKPHLPYPQASPVPAQPYLTFQHTVKQLFPTEFCFVFNNHLSLQGEESHKHWPSVTIYWESGEIRVLSAQSKKGLKSLPRNINPWGAQRDNSKSLSQCSRWLWDEAVCWELWVEDHMVTARTNAEAGKSTQEGDTQAVCP